MQSNEKTSTKRVNSSSSHNSGPQKRKKNNITRSTPRLILPNSQQPRLILPNSQQKVSQAPLQLQQQNIQVQQQRNILPQLQQQDVSSQNPSQEKYVPRQYEIDPQLYNLPFSSSEIKENYDENALLVSF